MRRARFRRGLPNGTLGGDFWASYSDLMAGLLLVFMLITAYGARQVRALVEKPSDELRQWRQALIELCTDPELERLQVRPDCDTGTIELNEGIFFSFNSVALKENGKERLRQALPIIFRRLATDGRIRRKLEAIEIRGHSDWIAPPDDPYGRNLRVSQRRAFEVLHFLATDPGIPEPDRALLTAKGVASGAADRRCPGCEPRREECRARCRRVEIHFLLDDARYRSELYELFEELLRSLGRG